MGVDGLGHVNKAFRIAWLQRYRRDPKAWRVNTPLRDFEHKSAQTLKIVNHGDGGLRSDLVRLLEPKLVESRKVGLSR